MDELGTAIIKRFVPSSYERPDPLSNSAYTFRPTYPCYHWNLRKNRRYRRSDGNQFKLHIPQMLEDKPAYLGEGSDMYSILQNRTF